MIIKERSIWQKCALAFSLFESLHALKKYTRANIRANIIRSAASTTDACRWSRLPRETIKLIWKGVDSMTKSIRFELISGKLPVSFQTRSLRRYLPTFAFAFSPKILGFYTKEKKENTCRKLVCSTSHLPLLLNPNPLLPETPSSELGSKRERATRRSPRRESWPGSCVLAPVSIDIRVCVCVYTCIHICFFFLQTPKASFMETPLRQSPACHLQRHLTHFSHTARKRYCLYSPFTPHGFICSPGRQWTHQHLLYYE